VVTTLRSHLLAASFSVLGLCAQTAPTLAVDANANRNTISPYIYGVNEWSDDGLMGLMRIPAIRWGGDDATSYNWQNSVKNNTGDNPWCYENYSVSPNFDAFHTANLTAGTVSLGTIPLMDWSPQAAGECSFSVKKYGAQKATAPDNPDCGNGVLLNGDPVVNDPNDAYIPVTRSFAQQWVQEIMTGYGPANAGGVRLWSMDNEPEWWYSNHIDVYPQAATYGDMMARNIKWATAVKAVDPTALITGPVPGGWSGMLFSRADMGSGWNTSPYQYWDNPTDQKAHGGVPWVPYCLQQMNQFEQANIAPSGLSSSQGDSAMETLRMTSTRALWDPNYLVPGGGFNDATGTEVSPHLVPQLQQWVTQNYLGTNLAITEYSWGALDSITGAIGHVSSYSMTLLVIPQAQSAMSAQQPVVSAVTNAASYGASGVSPGEIMTIWGQSFGPARIDRPSSRIR
jgi:hypothetical protein